MNYRHFVLTSAKKTLQIMASVKIKFQPDRPNGGKGANVCGDEEGHIVLTVTHNSLSRSVATDYRVYSSEWDRRVSRFIVPADSSRLKLIGNYREELRRDVGRLRRIIISMENRDMDFSADDVVEAFRMFVVDYSLRAFMTHQIEFLKERGRLRTAETYSSALRSFMRFRRGRDLLLDCLTQEMVMRYESYLRSRGLTPNSTSFYMRILRAVYNRAVEQGGVPQEMPFRKVYTGVERTRKRALTLTDIRRILRLDFRTSPSLDYARDMFMLSFYMRGMSLIDMAHLKKADLEDGHITYRRRKTGQCLCVAWTQEMQYISDKYNLATSPYLLPLISPGSKNTRVAYRNVAYRINRSLKIIGAMIGYGSPLTLYCARHSWASIAQAKNIPVSVISAGMGHNSEKTTRIYLASLDTSTVDRANSIILKALR